MERKSTTTTTSCPTDAVINSDMEDLDALLAENLAIVDEGRDCDSDAALALMLQRQFDREYDDQLKQREDRLNGKSKVGVSLDRFKRNTSYDLKNIGDNGLDRDSSGSDEDGCFTTNSNGGHYKSNNKSNNKAKSRSEDRVWDVFEQGEIDRRGQLLGRAGFVKDHDGNIITKHDIPTTSRRNMCRLMELKTDIETGDAAKYTDDFKITNYVYNRLKVHSKKNTRRQSQRAFDKKDKEEASILEDVQAFKISDATRAIIDGLLIAFKIEKLNGVIGHGKESTILHATGRDHENVPDQEVAIKIFKTNRSEFRTRDSYDKTKCPSYKFDKLRHRADVINKWAEKGFKNLKLMRKANINCPDAISLKKHVLIMTFLGRNACPSPQLREARLNAEELELAYGQVVDIMDRLYKHCDLVHADLSEYNLLWHDEKIFVIDVSQSIDVTHPNANRFLYRDCNNITTYFSRRGAEKVIDTKELFKQICGKDLTDKDIELWSKIEQFPSNEKQMQRQDPNGHDPFDQFLESITNTSINDPAKDNISTNVPTAS